MSESQTTQQAQTSAPDETKVLALGSAEWRISGLVDAAGNPLNHYFRWMGHKVPDPATATRAQILEWASTMSNMTAGADYKCAEQLGTPIDLVAVFAHPVTFRKEDKETGEVEWVEGIRTVLLDRDGTTYDTTADGIVDSLRLIFGLPGIGSPESWQMPLPIKIKQVSVRNVWRTFKILVRATDTPPEEQEAEDRPTTGRRK